jgi:hypothetical protein
MDIGDIGGREIPAPPFLPAQKDMYDMSWREDRVDAAVSPPGIYWLTAGLWIPLFPTQRLSQLMPMVLPAIIIIQRGRSTPFCFSALGFNH